MFFSIALPVYKGKFLRECILSILNQSYNKFEVIIVNDCSPDAIDEIVAEFNDDNRIKYYKNEKNIGAEKLVDNWNDCLKKANGDFFIMMGDDDKMEPDYLEEFVKLIIKYPDFDVFHCRCKIIDENSIPFNLTPSWPEIESVYDNIYHKIMEIRQQFVSDFVYRRTTLVSNGGYYYLPLAWASDNITAHIACGNKGIAHINKTIFNYRSNRFSISSSGNSELKLRAICLEKEWYDNFLIKEPTDINDRILWLEIKRILNKRIQKKKTYTLTVSLRNKPLRNIYFWYTKRKTYNFTSSELSYSIFQALINRLSAKKY